MRNYPRKRQQRLFGGILIVFAAINLLFFFILYRPVRSEYFQLQDSIQKSRAEVQARTLKIERLEKLSTQLDTSAQDRQRLVTQHFIPKNSGWSEVVMALNSMVQTSGVRNQRKDYSIAESPQYGLYSVKIRLPVSGIYARVVDLVKEIETADEFFIIDSIDLRGGATPGVQDISMNLNLETFFYQ
jgi:Tfp pilus assembly protein PilO